MPTNTCPSREMFLQYSLGLVSEEQSNLLAEHLDSCPDCQDVVMTLDDADDTVVGRLRMPLSGESFVAEPQLQRALAAAIAMPMPRPNAKGGSDLEGELASDIPEALGEYQLLEELGRGGMGRVYKALQTKLDRVVAVKVLPRGRVGDRQAINRFEREMKAVGRLAHPNIVQAYDAREINDMPVLIMEFVDGLDLAELVRRAGPVPVAEACELVRRTALALQCAHEHGLVHRDIKPSNIMLTPAGEVKLLDLGLARFYAEGGAGVAPVSAGEEMTGTGQAMGTADYMAPEQASDSRTVDIRADLYSLGCTLYKLLSGRAPFSGPEYRSTLDKLNAHVHQPAPPIRDLAPDVPKELAAVLDRMLAKDPGDRFAAPAYVAEALEPFCKGANLADLIGRAMGIDEGAPSQRERASASPLSHRERARVRAAAPSLRRPILKRILIGLGFLGALAVGFAAGIVIMINRDGKETKIEVPDGSNARVTADGQLEVTLPGQTKPSEQPSAARTGAAPSKTAVDESAKAAFALLRSVETARTKHASLKATFTFDGQQCAVEMDGSRRRFEILAGNQTTVTLVDGDKLYGYLRKEGEDLCVYDMPYAIGVRGDRAFDPRILGLSDMMSANETVKACLWHESADKLKLVAAQEFNGGILSHVRAIRDDARADYWIEERAARVRRMTIGADDYGIQIEVASEFDAKDKTSPFPSLVRTKRVDKSGTDRHRIIVSSFEFDKTISADRFTLKSLNIPTNTKVVELSTRGPRSLGYWDGENICNPSAPAGASVAPPKAPAGTGGAPAPDALKPAPTSAPQPADRTGQSTATTPFAFRTTTVTHGDITSTIGASGTIEPEEVIDVGAQVTGRVVSLGADPRSNSDPSFKDRTIDYGSPVEEGTVLARIDDALYRARVDQQKAGWALAEAELAAARAKAKGETPEGAKTATVVAEAAVAQAKAALKEAEINLDRTIVKSPIKGVIVDRRVNVGQNAGPSPNSAGLFLIAKTLEKMQVWASVNEADIGRIRKGMEATFTVAAFPKDVFKGTVTQIRLNATMTQNVATYTVVVDIEKPDRKLLPYMTANLLFQVAKRENVFRVDNAALKWRPSSDQVTPDVHPSPLDRKSRFSSDRRLWVIAPDGKHVRPVDAPQIGLTDGTMTEISGPDVKEGMEVVVGQMLGPAS